MRIHKLRKKDRDFNLLILKMYSKLNKYVFVKTKSFEITNEIVFNVFEKLYDMDADLISSKDIEKLMYKIAFEEIENKEIVVWKYYRQLMLKSIMEKNQI